MTTPMFRRFALLFLAAIFFAAPVQAAASEHQAQKKDCFAEGLSERFERFYQKWYTSKEPLFNELKKGQNPTALVIACSDSRVDPALVTSSRPGDIFVLRNVANIVFPHGESSIALGQNAAIEYAVKHLNVAGIVVMGHASCGGIHALISSKDKSANAGHHHGEADEFIGSWIAGAERAYEKVESLYPDASPEEKSRACEMWNARLSTENLLTFPWIKEAVEQGKLHLHAMYFDLQKGELLVFDPKDGNYRKVD